MRARWIIVLLVLASAISGQEKHPAFMERVEERRQLVYSQVKHYPGIKISSSAVLDALFRVPRHAFVPVHLQEYAYRNQPLPIGFEQTISQPVIVASMTELLDLKGHEKILEIGTGSGYQAAVLAEMGADVYSIEIIDALGKMADSVLKALGYKVHIKVGDGYKGWEEFAPFDRIIVTCAPENVPDALVDQLKPGGRMVIPVGAINVLQYLMVLKKDKKGRLREDYKYPVRFVPMIQSDSIK